MKEREKVIMSRKAFEEQLVKKAQSDRQFKQQLVDNPKQTLKQLGIKIPENLDIKVVEESPQVAYIVLPVNPDEEGEERANMMQHLKCNGNNCVHLSPKWYC